MSTFDKIWNVKEFHLCNFHFEPSKTFSNAGLNLFKDIWKEWDAPILSFQGNTADLASYVIIGE